MLATSETATLAEQLISEACDHEGVQRDQLTIHSDRGAPMTSKIVAQFLAELGVTRSLSRPHVSNDNPFSESHFKTLKYRPTFPQRFGGFEDAHGHLRDFFPWYNEEHRHSAIAWLTPADVHHGNAARVLGARQAVLAAAYAAHPERFVRKAPQVPPMPLEVWINPPVTKCTLQDAPGATMSRPLDPYHHPILTQQAVTEILSTAAAPASITALGGREEAVLH